VDVPDWTFVAARLFIYDLYHRVSRNLVSEKGSKYPHLKEYFYIGETEGRIVLGLKDKYDLDDLNAYLKPQRDLQFSYLGIKTLYDRYLLKNRHNDPIELPQLMFMAVAMFLAQNEENRQEWAKKFYDILSKFEVMAATPTLSNARTPRHQLSSCYVGSTPDNIEGIFDAFKEMALLSKYGGGIGWDWSRIRASNSYIDGHKNAAGGIVPFLKIANDIAVAVDQLGTRKGAISVYIETWHADILDFIDLRKNSGEERRRTHDIFPALWINDIFMKRVEANESWTLFDPFYAKGLTEVYGKEFEELYIKLENDENIPKETMPAKELWKRILTSYFETGNPFLCFKDASNKANPNFHSGLIRSSNLCTEIFQNTDANKYLVKVKFDNGEVIELEEDFIIKTGEGVTKPANKISSLDSIDGKKVFIVEKTAVNGQTAVCNLASINLSKIHTKEDIERVVPIAVRMLDNVIELNFYPVAKVKETNVLSRAIGLGVMGEAEMLASKQISWGSDKHFAFVDEIMELVSFNAIKTSSDLSVEKGKYPLYDGSLWSQGILPMDHANEATLRLTDRGLFTNSCDWDALRDKIKKDGMRNGYLMAIAPTSSISILVGTTQTIEPIYKRKWFEENLSGLIPVTVPQLSIDTWEYYQTAYDLDQQLLIKAAAIRQKWIDQGQSLNIFMKVENASGRALNDIYMLAWKLGLKSTYYLRSQSKDHETVDREDECDSCQ
jgi:ribonucleoside-diphosphate reductase alpha chain